MNKKSMTLFFVMFLLFFGTITSALAETDEWINKTPEKWTLSSENEKWKIYFLNAEENKEYSGDFWDKHIKETGSTIVSMMIVIDDVSPLEEPAFPYEDLSVDLIFKLSQRKSSFDKKIYWTMNTFLEFSEVSFITYNPTKIDKNANSLFDISVVLDGKTEDIAITEFFQSTRVGINNWSQVDIINSDRFELELEWALKEKPIQFVFDLTGLRSEVKSLLSEYFNPKARPDYNEERIIFE